MITFLIQLLTWAQRLAVAWKAWRAFRRLRRTKSEASARSLAGDIKVALLEQAAARFREKVLR